MNFDEYVAGRTIAVVGPAPLTHDQSGDIDGHDLVYRVAQYAGLRGWYGTRCDLVYLNGQLGRTILDDDQSPIRQAIDGATWWVYKADNSRQFRPDGAQRTAHKPTGVTNPNAITGILWDLTHFHPASITVYGADLYAGGPEHAYYDGYDRHELAVQARGVVMHQPWQQMRAHRAIHATGLIAGDDRYLAAVTMPDDRYQAVIDSWQRTYETLT